MIHSGRRFAWGVRLAVLGACLASTAGCASRRASSGWVDAPYPVLEPSSSTRIMLVAGGDDVANFAQEVAHQRQIWRRAGIAAADIACYWAKPTPAGRHADRRQYDALGDEMSRCGEASAAVVLDDIERVASSAPSYFYLYVTAHGVASLGGDARTWVLPAEEQAFLAQPALALDADPAVRVGDTNALLRAYATRSRRVDRIALTPASLRTALAAFPPSTHKIVVLQGCFSGGFLRGADALTGLPNTTVLTAAAADRPSFGCGSGTRETFWGAAMGRELGERVHPGVSPDELVWHDVYVEVSRRVRKLERALGQRQSHPQFGQSSTP